MRVILWRLIGNKSAYENSIGACLFTVGLALLLVVVTDCAMSFNLLLADAILTLHLVIVIFIAGGAVTVWIGHFLGWRFVRNRAVRFAHLAAMAFVTLESLVGVVCPLTRWEDQLRGKAPAQGTFMQRLLHPILFYDLPPVFFTVAYVIVFLLVVASFRWVRLDPLQR